MRQIKEKNVNDAVAHSAVHSADDDDDDDDDERAIKGLRRFQPLAFPCARNIDTVFLFMKAIATPHHPFRQQHQ